VHVDGIQLFILSVEEYLPQRPQWQGPLHQEEEGDLF
jgi:hypothetical protein